MDTIHLPLLPADTKAETALTAMRWLQKVAAIRKSSNLHIVSAGAVVLALAKQVTSFANVPSKSEVREVTLQDVAHWRLNKLTHIRLKRTMNNTWITTAPITRLLTAYPDSRWS